MAATPKTPLSAHIFTSLLLHHPVLNLVFDQNRVCKVFTTLWRQSVEKTFHTLFWSKTRVKTNSCRFVNPLEKLRAKTVPWIVCWPTTQHSSSSSGDVVLVVVACPNPGSAISTKLNTKLNSRRWHDNAKFNKNYFGFADVNFALHWSLNQVKNLRFSRAYRFSNVGILDVHTHGGRLGNIWPG